VTYSEMNGTHLMAMLVYDAVLGERFKMFIASCIMFYMKVSDLSPLQSTICT